MTVESTEREAGVVRRHTFGSFAARQASRIVPGIAAGRLIVDLPWGGRVERVGKLLGPDVLISVHRWRALAKLMLGGEVSFAASYLDGDWSTPDPLRLFELVMLNETMRLPARRFSGIARLLDKIHHGLHRNTRSGSKRNIAAHYDLGNDFYQQWLDRSMTYSAALFADDETLEEAQQNKIRHVSRLLELRGGERVLEIGCGWGALAEGLVRQEGSHFTGITLSEQQFAYASDRLRPEIARNQAELRLQDYRDLGGRFDRIVSIEMFEAVGEAYWRTYFDVVKKRLAQNGIAVLQVITIAEDRFEKYRRTPDFIQRYIFHGGMLPTKTHLRDLAAGAGLEIMTELSFGIGYARTLAEWRSRFKNAWPRLLQLGFDDRFRRMWDYYLSYCEAGFRAGATDVVLIKLRALEQ
ncbi:class I SAM-dependent methyltransferase [Mesorhizobium marinum]|uniref:class I SAM-dependent methyltransferase n=1 Tax=Mesorhizobium marinum TaxID=3228790 RepID=UPI003465ECB7